MTTLTPAQLRIRQLLIKHTCQSTAELHRESRMDELVDSHLQRCAWCGTWADKPSCARCTPTHPIGETP